MALGSPLGLHFDSSVSTHVGHPYSVEKLIGWWDFTDKLTMYTGSIGSLSSIAINDPIKQITNKANSGTDNLGLFLRTANSGTTTNSANTLKLAVINSKVKWYCNRIIDETITAPAVFATSRVDGWGGVVNGNALGTSGTFSTATINNQNLTIFFAIDSQFTDVVGSAQGDHFLGIAGSLGGYVDSGPPHWPGFRVSADTSSDEWLWKTPQLDDSASPEDINLDTNVDLTTDFEIWTIENDTGTNATKMYRNFDTSDGASTTLGSTSGSINYDMSDGWFSLGGFSINKFHNGVYADNMVNIRIFEVLVYNKTLTDNEKQSVKNYFTNKYNL